MHIGQPALYAVVVERQPRVIEPEQVQDGGMEIVHRDGLLGRLVTDVIGSAVANPLLQPGPRQPAGEAKVVMIAAARADPFRERCPAELRRPEDERVVEHAALLEILEETRTRL